MSILLPMLLTNMQLEIAILAIAVLSKITLGAPKFSINLELFSLKCPDNQNAEPASAELFIKVQLSQTKLSFP